MVARNGLAAIDRSIEVSHGWAVIGVEGIGSRGAESKLLARSVEDCIGMDRRGSRGKVRKRLERKVGEGIVGESNGGAGS